MIFLLANSSCHIEIEIIVDLNVPFGSISGNYYSSDELPDPTFALSGLLFARVP